MSRLSVPEQILFAKRLSILIRAGLPIMESMRILRHQAPKPATRLVFDQLITDIEEGQFLSTSMRGLKHSFSEFAVNIIEVGEISGTLSQNLEYLAEELKKKHVLRRKAVGALIYPLLILGATIGMSSLLLVYIFPKIIPLFLGLRIALPWTTRTLIFIHTVLTRHWLLLLGLILAAVIGGWRLWRVQKVKAALHTGIIRLPLMGTIAQNYNMTLFCRTLGLLLKSEVAIVKATAITARSMTNLAYRQEILLLSQSLLGGEKLSAHLQDRRNLFPSMVTHMVTVGEATGTLGDTLLYAADLYEQEVEEATMRLSTLLEPLLMIIMGLMVGFVAVSIISPIYEITQNIRQ